MKVIVIDDSLTVRQLVAVALSADGFEVLEAVDGVDGLALIERTPDAAIVLCDVNMPRMDGLEMLETMKKNPRHAAIPVVMLTTEGHPQLIDRAKKNGAKGWIVKPFKAELLLAAVKKLTART